jgi:hypothetical protein
VAAASLLLNYAASVHKSMDEETQIQLLSVLSIRFLTFIITVVKVAAASLLLNYAVSVHKSMDEETQIQLLSVLSINFLTFITGEMQGTFLPPIRIRNFLLDQNPNKYTDSDPDTAFYLYSEGRSKI